MNRAATRCDEGRLAEARSDLEVLGEILAKPGGDADFENKRLLMLAEVEFAAGHASLAASLCEKILARLAGAQDLLDAKMVLTNLACYRLALGDVDAAERAGKRAIAPWFILSRTDKAIAIQHLAAVAGIRRQAASAARLWGFTDAYFGQAGFKRPFSERRSHDVLVATVRQQLSEDAVADFMREGAHLSLEEARDEVLSALDESRRTGVPG